jgi:hypothetical protein
MTHKQEYSSVYEGKLEEEDCTSDRQATIVAGTTSRIAILMLIINNVVMVTRSHVTPAMDHHTTSPSLIPPCYSDYAVYWASIKIGLDHIMAADGQAQMAAEYMSLYTVVYNCITSSKRSNPGALLYGDLSQYFITQLQDLREVSKNFVWLDLAAVLNLIIIAQQSDSLQDEAFLRYYAAQWGRYETAAAYINRIFAFFNRHWVKQMRNEGKKDTYFVDTVWLFHRSPTMISLIHIRNRNSLHLCCGNPNSLFMSIKNSPAPCCASSSNNEMAIRST